MNDETAMATWRTGLCRRMGVVFVTTAALYGSTAFARDAKSDPAAKYETPYTVEFKAPLEELVYDLEHTERGDWRFQSEVPHHDWYLHETRVRWKAWGPPARTYSPPVGIDHQPSEWKRERLIAVGLGFVGYGYQHHHIPDWHPPAGWPWKETAVGHNGKGLDCSNFTSFVYNLAYGIRFTSEVHQQSQLLQMEIPAVRETLPLWRIDLPETMEERRKKLRTGDLLFIRNARGDHVSHVVFWVGDIGQSRDGAPLILDSHGEGVRDSEGQHIPAGIQLRPYHENSWYFRSSSHALRLFVD